MTSLKRAIAILAVLMTLASTSWVLAAEPVNSTIGTYTLDKCLELASANSLDLKTADKNISIAEEGVHQAQSGFLPTVSYNVSVSKSNSGGIVGWVPVNPPDYSNWMPIYSSNTSCGGSISVNLPLFDGGKLTNSLKIALLKLEYAKEAERSAKQQLKYNVKSAFYALWLAEKKLDVAQTSYNNMGQHVQQISRYVQVGSKSKYDLLKAEVMWKEQNTKVISAKNQVVQAKLNLATLVGLDKDKDFEIKLEDSILQLPKESGLTVASCYDSASNQRPEIRQSKQNIEMAKINVELVKAGFKPELSLSGSYQSQGSNLSVQDWSNTFQIKVGLSGVIYDGSKTKSKINEAQQNLDVANISDGKIHDQIRQEVQITLLDLDKDLAETDSNQSNVELATESLKMTQIRFSAGMATSLDVKDAQLSLDEAQNNYYQSIASYLSNAAKVELETGKD